MSTFATSEYETHSSPNSVENIWSDYKLYIILGTVFVCLICVAIPCLCYGFKRQSKKAEQVFDRAHIQYIRNALAVVISIGEYDKNLSQFGDVVDGFFDDMQVEKDVAHYQKLFALLNYKFMPTQLKTYWTEAEVIAYLQDTVGPEISRRHRSGKLVYDGLIVCVSSHGLKDQIVTSDYRTIEKTVLHRIISIRYRSTREIPRIFLFDACEGTAERVESLRFIRPPTVNVEEFVDHSGDDANYDLGKAVKKKTKNGKRVGYLRQQWTSPKAVQLKDVSTERDWTTTSKNPDYKLAVIHGANPGFQCKFNSVNGSYLTYEFTQRMMHNLNANREETLSQIFDGIQQQLHDRGKQQTVQIFNNYTGYIVLKAKQLDDSDDAKEEEEKMEIAADGANRTHVSQRTKDFGKQKMQYTSLATMDIDDEVDNAPDQDEQILDQTCRDVLKMRSIDTLGNLSVVPLPSRSVAFSDCQ